MNPSQEQNRQEALLALEQLSEGVGQRGFHHHQQRFQELLKSLKLAGPELEEIQARLEELKSKHHSWQSEQSGVVKRQAEEKLAAARELFKTFQFQQAYDALEEIHHLLEFERQSLTREDRDACWDALKAARKELREARSHAAEQVETQAQAWFDEAKQAIETRRFREAKDAFQALQREVNQLPLRRDQRQQWREKFNELWEQLQASGKTQREAAQQRQVEGRRKLEEALSKVESFINRKEQDLKAAEARMGEAHWHEVDPIEKQVKRDRDALEDARRRQRELKAKLEDNGRRRGQQSPKPSEGQTEGAQAQPDSQVEPQAEPAAEQASEQTAEQTAEPVEAENAG